MEDTGGALVETTSILDGSDGTTYFVVTGMVPFDPWFPTGGLGDADGDGDVDMYDAFIVSDHFLESATHLTEFYGDFNGDLVVDQLDMDILVQNLGFNAFDFFYNYLIPFEFGDWVENCDGQVVWIPGNVEFDCDDDNGDGGNGGEWPPYWPAPPPGGGFDPPFPPPSEPPPWFDPGELPPRDPPIGCAGGRLELALTNAGYRFERSYHGELNGEWVERDLLGFPWITDDQFAFVAVAFANGGQNVEWNVVWEVTEGSSLLEIHEDNPLDTWRGPWLQFKPVGQGYVTIKASYTWSDGCTAHDSWRFLLIEGDLDVDSDNDPSTNRTSQEDAIEDAPVHERLGKIIFVSTTDSDDDGVEDFADGMNLDRNEPIDWEADNESPGTEFTPMHVEVVGLADPALIHVRFEYEQSAPEYVRLPDATAPHRPNRYRRPLRTQWNNHNGQNWGIFRIWKKDGHDGTRNVWIDQGPLDYIGAGWAIGMQELSNTVASDRVTAEVFVEAVYPVARNPIKRERERMIYGNFQYLGDINRLMRAGGALGSDIARDAVAIDAFEVRMFDPRSRAVLEPITDNPSLNHAEPNYDDYEGNASFALIDGAITDGVSVCHLFVSPPLPAEITDRFEIRIEKWGDPNVNIPKVVGTFAPAGTLDGNGRWLLPKLPTEWNDVLNDVEPSSAELSDLGVLYVPPETYAVTGQVSPPFPSLNDKEYCQMAFRLSWQGNDVGAAPFILRRPPVMLVHGIMSDPATWDDVIWNEGAGNPLRTRVRKVDWSATSTKGYTENYYKVARAIEDVLVEYRTAQAGPTNFNLSLRGRHFAATRADAVGHSQGGQLIRWYIADGMGAPPLYVMARTDWNEVLDNTRNPYGADGRWPYLRAANYGAGSIRRFISIGSPFKGSPWANTVEPLFASNGQWHMQLLQYRDLLPGHVLPDPFEELLFNNGVYDEPTCVADLAQLSEAQQALANAEYPTGHRRVRWHPIVGIATEDPQEAPVESILWELLFTFVGDTGSTIGEISPLNPGNSDLIVPIASQRNIIDNENINHPNYGIGEEFPFHAHSEMGPLDGETQSHFIRNYVVDLLSGYPVPAFGHSWSLGH